MIDKEKIIIDGVDVSECVSFDKLNGQNICCYEDTREDKIPFTNFCVENKDCYFKQLIRKTQECESLNKRASSLEEIADDLQQRNHHLTQECEELKNNLHIANTNHEAAEKECDRYRKALEEIEREIIAMHYVTILFHRGITHGLADIVQEYKNKILDIISKAKGEE